MQNIYIVEDDTNILEIETYALKGSGYAISGFENAASFYQALESAVPDLVLLDIMLPDEDGLSVLEKLRSAPATRELPIILVTAKTSEIDTVKGLDSGADDYISKPFGVMELISRVRALLRRSSGRLESTSLELGPIILETEKRLCTVDGIPVDLTYKEYELLCELVRNAGIVMKRNVLMENIWGIDFEGESRTLDSHIKTLRKKLGKAGFHIQTVRNVGYLAKES